MDKIKMPLIIVAIIFGLFASTGTAIMTINTYYVTKTELARVIADKDREIALLGCAVNETDITLHKNKIAGIVAEYGAAAAHAPAVIKRTYDDYIDRKSILEQRRTGCR